MAFKSTKAIPLKSTKKPSKTLDHAKFTEKLSLESKSSSDSIGLEAEKLVIQFYLQKKYKLLKHRWRTPFAEVDLLFAQDRKLWLLVEVKTVSHQDFILHRISARQKARLLKARHYIESKYEVNVELAWAFVQNSQVLEIVT